MIGAAPEFTNIQGWFNSEPLSLAELRAEGRVVLIDFWTYTCINCQVRYVHFGEGEYGVTEDAIRALLAEAGDERLGKLTTATAEWADPGVETPEVYLGAARAEGFVNGAVPTGETAFGFVGDRVLDVLPPNAFAYQGTWRIGPESAAATRRSRIDGNFAARKVFLVLGSPDKKRRLEVRLDGKPIPDRLAGPDVKNGFATIDKQRLYRLIDLPKAGRHTLTLLPERGISGYAFTFG